MLRLSIALSIALLVLPASKAVAQVDSADEPIEWSVVDRFRLFDQANESARNRVEQLMDRLATSTDTKLEPHYGVLLRTLSGADAASLRRSNWSPERRRYADGYLRPAHYRVTARLRAAPDGRCLWSVDGREQPEPVRCHSPVELELRGGLNQGRWGGAGLVEVRDRNGTLIATQQIQLQDRLIVALGDSFASGEGNPDVPADFSGLAPGPRFQRVEWPAAIDPRRDGVKVAEWWDEPCHRSLLSWPVLAGLKMSAMNRHEATTLVSLACSGATVPDGLLGPQIGLPGCPEDAELRTCPQGRAEVAGQVAQLRRLLGETPTDRPIDRVFLSIGGNDIGFVGVIGYGLLPANGFLVGNWAAAIVGDKQGIVCPFEEADDFLRRFCGDRHSAARRLDGLAGFYDQVDRAFDDLGIAPTSVVQVKYPDILHDDRALTGLGSSDGLAASDVGVCHHALLSGDQFGESEAEASYRQEYGERLRPHGFEATQAVIPAFARGFRVWNWQYHHPADTPCVDARDPNASEVCKSLWVWRRLNENVEENERFGWRIVSSHVAQTRGHGWCLSNPEHPLALPLSRRLPNGSWVWARYSAEREQDMRNFYLNYSDPRGPGDFQPYAKDRPRWFRNTNDSFMTQYGGPGRIHQGTVHPTFRAHVAYAEGVLEHQ